MRLIPKYLALLCKEITHTAAVAAGLGLRLESVYVGGGTPTTLSAEQLKTLLDTVRSCFDLSTCRELTVEAGRPDTITAEKLEALKSRGVTRISINPQTLNDDVLQNIGRRHTTQQTLSAYALAREHGFRNINMDLIVGLPGDSVESFQSTLDRVVSLSPESVTVHALALKRSARIFQEGGTAYSRDSEAAGQMLDYADSELLKNGYNPYYLYRQSRMIGNLENTGWAKPGFESPYNVFIMDETHSILACGAGAASIVKDPHSNRLERIFNFKYPYEYISRFEEMIIRKDQVKDLYERFRRIPE
ncbi:MAG TPA: coproporphyrinogen dehydrogenase HemZ [Clostridia bacterium]|nr:coproporphyrinogen dehydrogenase HemZ [Clostridia bacterium]